MERVKMGMTAKTKIDKKFESSEGTAFIKKGTWVTVCDTDILPEGYLLVEITGYSIVFDYAIDELDFQKYDPNA